MFLFSNPALESTLTAEREENVEGKRCRVKQRQTGIFPHVFSLSTGPALQYLEDRWKLGGNWDIGICG